MKPKPKGPKYRNLFARGGVIYYQREVRGARIRFSCDTAEWDVAAAVRDLYEQRKGIGRLAAPLLEVPTLAAFAKRYLEEDTSHLAETTQRDRVSQLRADGPLLSFLGARRLDEITAPLLREWWSAKILGRGLSTKTGRAYVDVLASILGYARDLGVIESSPIGDFREMLRRRSRTKQGRADNEPGRHVRPIEDPAALARLVAQASVEGPVAEVTVLLCLDAGLRLGEAMALRWGSIVWGFDADDRARSLRIEETRSRGGDATAPKSGRSRRVALSRRLRVVLLDLYRKKFEPGPEVVVLEGIEPNNFRHRSWRRICKQADLGTANLKDLRDTFASQLLTAGVQLGYVSQQLGHADVGVTAKHYARWCGGDLYREPMQLGPGEVPADLIARLESPQSHPTQLSAQGRRNRQSESKNPRSPGTSEGF
jgi:integrase